MIYYILFSALFFYLVKKIFFRPSPENLFIESNFRKGNLQIHSKETSQKLYDLHKDAKKDFPKLISPFLVALIKSYVVWKPVFDVFSLTTKEASEYYLPVDVEDGLFIHNTIISSESKTIIEFGTSFGISTIYCASAAKETKGTVITSELEPNKVITAKQNIKEANLSQYVVFLEGDAMKTIEPYLTNENKKIDFLFLDGWKDLYLPLLKQLEKFFKNGTIIVADNVDMNCENIKRYLSYVRDASNGYTSTTLNKRTEYSIYTK
eukprot:TRINITY_DN8889_c0_g1_i1.p1 TRINITY_DN8889_c0_g1~~TRINITY_DN8889_c0_g1_i1.p1  ORF type:complete len:264 (-),score=72.89 TRINITY_DN8889_c0_g1_i1:7-798(-)